MIIRKAVVQDYDAFCMLIEDADRLHREHLPNLFREASGSVRSRTYFADLLDDEDVTAWVAEISEEMVGCIVVGLREAADIPILVPRRYAFVDTLVVAEDFRRCGVGSALMAQAEQWAIDRGASSMELNVYEFNDLALNLYHKLGYQTLSRRMSRPL